LSQLQTKYAAAPTNTAGIGDRLENTTSAD
uniref:Adhesin n=1 Tax=Gongylonema pulchrum TaxID=637853 RepID=A0A183EN05_9BILA